MRLKWSWRWMAAALVAIAAARAVLVQMVPELRWRATVLGKKLSGKVPKVPLTEMARSAVVDLAT